MHNMNITFTTEYAAKAGEKYYFVASEMNVVCSIDIKENKMEIVGCIPDEGIFTERVSIKIVVWNEELIFIPMNGKKIWFFHIAEKKWRSVSIKNEDIQRKVRQAFIYRERLFMIGCHYPAVVSIDLRTKEIEYIDAPYKAVKNYYKKASGVGYFRHDCVIKEHLLYIASFITNKVLIFNLDNFEWKYITIGNSENGFSGIAWDGEFFWLSPNNEPFVIRWDGKKLYEKYSFSCQSKDEIVMFTGVVSCGKNIIFPAKDAKYTLMFRKTNGEEWVQIEKRYSFYNICNNEVIYGTTDGKIGIIRPNNESFIIQCSCKISELLEKMNITIREYKDFFCDKFLNIVHENGNLNLNELLCYLNIMQLNKVDLYKNVTNNKRIIWNRLIEKEFLGR
jgi:hypothetical protein